MNVEGARLLAEANFDNFSATALMEGVRRQEYGFLF
jgi:hypothetical protein